jgi:hypothetical protein
MRIVQIPSAEGLINLELDATDSADGRMSFSAEGAVQVATESFEKALTPIRSAAKIVAEQFASPLLAADDVEVEIGVKFNSKVGFYIAGADAGASLKITLKWKRGSQQGQNQSASADSAS